MFSLLNAKKSQLKNCKKGFTMVELIVVIVIIAILIAALAPAVLGVIERANNVADQSDCRQVMSGFSVAFTSMETGALDNDSGLPTPAAVESQFSGGVNIKDGTYKIFYEGQMAVGAEMTAGQRSKTGTEIKIGNTTGGDYISYTVSGGTFTLANGG